MNIDGHSLRVRADRWELIEKKAWKLSMQSKRPVKPTDVADAILLKCVESLTLEDVQSAIENREK